ncbi:MAG: hypothetical protein PF961_07465 [Planctomycetota bacterium]|jgi:hypothetical protein|nr:hypothetical protein [Planctomycetota bacterium]
MSESNPFAAPDVAAVDVAAEENAEKRSIVPKVFGVLSLVFGIFGVLGGIVNVVLIKVLKVNVDQYEMLGQDPDVLAGMHAWSVVLAIILIFGGMRLIKYQNSGRYFFNVYAVLGLLGQVLMTAYMIMQLSQLEMHGAERIAVIGAVIGGIVGGLIGAIYPVLGLIMLNTRRVKSFLS